MTKEKKTEKDITRTQSFGAQMIFISGFLNCYTFVRHGGAFATMQTGNLIQASYNLAEGNWQKALSFLCYNLVFLSTTFVTKLLFDYVCEKNELKWKKLVLKISLIVMAGLCLTYPYLPDLAVNSIVAACAASQYCAFRSFGEHVPYATIFCTGNMRSLVDNIYNVLMKKDEACMENVKGYGKLLGSFAFGVILCSFAMREFGGLALNGVLVVLFVCLWQVSAEIKRK